MKASHLRLYLALSSVAALESCLFSQALAHEVEAISIKQTHSFFGKVIVTATNDSLRIDDKGGLGFVLVSKAPDWKVNIFRDDDKSIFSEEYKDYIDSGLVSEFILARRHAAYLDPILSLGQKDFMGFSVLRFRYPDIFEFLPLPKNTSRQIAAILCSAYRTYGVDGFPITQTTEIKQDLVAGNIMKGQQQRDLSTIAISKVKVAPAIFDAPKNYVKAKSVREVVSGSNSRDTESMKDLLDFHGRDDK